MPNFEELGLKVGPYFIEYKRPFLALIQDGGFARPKTSIPDRSWKRMVLAWKKEGPILNQAPWS